MQRQDVSKILRLLADHGLTAAQPDPANGTARLHQLTALGRACAGHPPDRTRVRRVDCADTAVAAATRSLPHHGVCPPNRDCDLLLLRPSTFRLVLALSSTPCPAFDLQQILAMPELSDLPEQTVARCVRTLAGKGLAAGNRNPHNRRTVSYHLTRAGYRWADHQLSHPDDPSRFPDGKRCWPNTRKVGQALVSHSYSAPTNAAMARMTGLKPGSIWQIRRLLVHRGLARWGTSTTSRHFHTRPIQLTEAGHAWAEQDIDALTAYGRERSMRGKHPTPAQDHVVAAVLEELANPYTAWRNWLPPMATLAVRYHVSEHTVASAMAELRDRGLIAWQQPSHGRAWAYAVLKPNSTHRAVSLGLMHRIMKRLAGDNVIADSAYPDHDGAQPLQPVILTLPHILERVGSDYTDPTSPWHHGDPTVADLAIHLGIPGASLPRLLREYLARATRDAGTVAHRPARSGRSAWHVPERPPSWTDPTYLTPPQLYAGLRWLLTFTHGDALPAPEVIANRYGLDHDDLLQAMTVFATAGAINAPIDPDNRHPWTRQHGWALSTRDPIVRAVVIELARRIDTGWYRWTGLDGDIHRRPFPTADEIAEQFHVHRHVACQAVMHLHRLGFLWAIGVPPRRFVDIATKCLLTLWGEHYALTGPGELRASLHHAATAHPGAA